MKKLYSTVMLASLLAGGLTAQEKGTENTLIDRPPEVTEPLPNFEAQENAKDTVIDLSQHFSDPDTPEAALNYAVTHISNHAVAGVTVSSQQMTIDYLAPGQTNVIINAEYNGQATADTFLIGVRPVIEGNYDVATFEEIPLDPESFWNGSDGSGGFTSGTLNFFNSYNPDWSAWHSWACSNTTDNTTPGFGNQYSAFSPVRLDSAAGVNYGVTYTTPYSQVNTPVNTDQYFPGFFVTNSTYTTLDMKKGSGFSKKFGGDDGTDPDWLKLTIRGNRNDGTHAEVEYFLADYRFEDPADDYIIETWQWVDLTPLGKVNTLSFSLSSTDNSDWGMNTPAYFCMDNLYTVPDIGPEILTPFEDQSGEPGQTLRFDLNNHFTDPDDDDRHFWYTLGDNSWEADVINPVIEGDSLLIELLAEGTSYLNVIGFSNSKSTGASFRIDVKITGTTQQSAGNLTLYPNPSHGLFTVTTDEVQPSRLVIHDLSGRAVHRNDRYIPGTVVDMSHLPRGTYLVKLRTERTTLTKKIILK